MQESKATLHVVPSCVASDGHLKVKDKRAVLEYIQSRGAKRGDVIRLESVAQYRNNGVYMYDGSFIVPLDYETDDYGAVPRSFTPIEEGLPIRYWSESIDHNEIVWVKTHTIATGIIGTPLYGRVPRTNISAAYLIFLHRQVAYTLVCKNEYPGKSAREQVEVMCKVLDSHEVVQAFEWSNETPFDGNTLFTS